MNKKTLTFLGLSLTLASCSDQSIVENDNASGQSDKVEPIVENNKRSREQWREQLAFLATHEPQMPNEICIAMCYEMAMPYAASYNCEACKHKTLFADKSPRCTIAGELNDIKTRADKLRKLGLVVVLDECCLCDHCYAEKYESTDNIEQGSLYWLITNDGKTVRTKYDDFDFYILRDFLKRKDLVTSFNGDVNPLKNYVPRLKELLLGETGEK